VGRVRTARAEAEGETKRVAFRQMSEMRVVSKAYTRY